MVFIKDEINRLRKKLLNDITDIDVYLYNYIRGNENNTDIVIPNNFRELAICGYSNKTIDEKIMNNILSRPPVKNMDFRSNIYELIGIFLLKRNDAKLENDLIRKYENTSLENKYLIYKIYPQIQEKLKYDIEGNYDIKSIIIKNILNSKMELPQKEAYTEMIKDASNISDLIILEDLYEKMIGLDIQYHDEPKDIIIGILKEFNNSIKSVTLKRRKDHDKYKIKDEYDVQDLLHVILKSIFPKVTPEENTPQVGGKTERADFIFKEFGIILEIKMIKDSDKDEKEFIKQIKIDIESYYRYNPKYMIFFIYDPQNKTVDRNHFFDLQGRTKKMDETGEYEFEVITILEKKNKRKRRKVMKKVLDMTEKEAKNYFMKNSSYFSMSLPEYLDFTNLLVDVDKKINNLPLAKLWHDKPEKYDDINYKFHQNKDGKFAWRMFQLIHPAIYVDLVNLITETENWKLIINRFKEFKSNEKIVCCSDIVESSSKTKDQGASIVNWWNNVEQKSIELSLKYNWIGITDITDCYGSIYTHSIAWALHGISTAKINRKETLIGNTIDKKIRNMTYGQTNGIPQGSSLMDFIAEIILGYGDLLLTEILEKEKIEDYTILRYRDDYRIFTKDESTLNKILKLLSENLSTLNFKMNTQKTTISI